MTFDNFSGTNRIRGRLSGVAAIALLIAANAAHADVMVQANGTVELGGTAITDPSLSAGPSATVADIIPLFRDASGNEAFIHSYATQTGLVGSRASGYGNFDIFSQGIFEETTTNTSGGTQAVSFAFRIDAGEVALQNPFGTSGSASVNFSIEVDNGSGFVEKFASGASVASSFLNPTTTLSGVNLPYIIQSSGARWDAYIDTVSLGDLANGQSLTVRYTIQSTAAGDSGMLDCSLGGGGDDIELAQVRFGLGGPGPSCFSAIARAGDPNNLNTLGDLPLGPGFGSTGGQPEGPEPGGMLLFAPVNTPVPEPSLLALIGLGLLGFARTRGQR